MRYMIHPSLFIEIHGKTARSLNRESSPGKPHEGSPTYENVLIKPGAIDECKVVLPLQLDMLLESVVCGTPD